MGSYARLPSLILLSALLMRYLSRCVTALTSRRRKIVLAIVLFWQVCVIPDASRLRGTTLKNTTHVVHGDLPVRSLISNYDKVARALRPTKFKWMLE